LLAIAAAMLVGTGCTIKFPTPIRSGELTQTIVRKSDGRSHGKLLLVDVSGVIGIGDRRDSSFFGEGIDLVTLVSESLALAVEDEDIKAVILRIDTPGGTVTASDLLYEEILDFKEKRDSVTVHACMMGMATSGGYYVAAAADDISAMPTTITGSIGVIAQFVSVRQLADMVGVKMRTIKSGANKDIGSPFEELTEEQRVILQGTIDELYERFVDVVAASRTKLTRERLLELADGRIYTAKQAKEVGLVDEIEYLPEMIERVEKKNGGSMTIVTYDPLFTTGSSLYASRSTGAPASASAPAGMPARVEVTHHLAGFGNGLAPGFYYLWAE